MTFGFRGFTPFLNVCKGLFPNIDSNKLSAFWRGPIEDDSIYNKLEDILEFLKHE